MEKKILIVDDRNEIRKIVRATLEIDGWSILEADCGESAVTAALEHKPDVIIMDMFMPGKLNGLEATEKILSESALANCKIIMLSGTDEDMREKALAAGVIDFIHKPFSPLDLIDKIETLFEREA